MEWLDLFTPDGVSLFAACAIIFVSFFTAALTAAFGLGGGVALLGAMSAAFPPAAVIPVHGAAQMGSNASRLFFLRAHVEWRVIAWFAAGSLLGAVLGGRVAIALPEPVLRAAVAGFILFTVWGPKPASLVPGARAFFGMGAIGTFLTMFFGATGPLVAGMLSATGFDRMKTVATHAAAMSVQHGLKSLAFGALGFAFNDWAAVIIAILMAGFAGAFVGSRILKAMPEFQFQRGFKLLLTMMALYLLYLAATG